MKVGKDLTSYIVIIYVFLMFFLFLFYDNMFKSDNNFIEGITSSEINGEMVFSLIFFSISLILESILLSNPSKSWSDI